MEGLAATGPAGSLGGPWKRRRPPLVDNDSLAVRLTGIEQTAPGETAAEDAIARFRNRVPAPATLLGLSEFHEEKPGDSHVLAW